MAASLSNTAALALVLAAAFACELPESALPSADATEEAATEKADTRGDARCFDGGDDNGALDFGDCIHARSSGCTLVMAADADAAASVSFAET
jgi:hypothetical protein